MKYSLLVLPICFVLACTPKASQVVDTADATDTAPTKAELGLSPCDNFDDAFDPDETSANYIIYKDFIDYENYDEAFKLWLDVYKEAPAADGKRDDIFTDGVFFYERLAMGAPDSITKAQYVNRIFELYEEAAVCYPERSSNLKAKKAFDLFFKFPDMASKLDIFSLFKEALDEDRSTKQYFVLNPMTSLLVDLYLSESISKEEALEYAQLMQQIMQMQQGGM